MNRYVILTVYCTTKKNDIPPICCHIKTNTTANASNFKIRYDIWIVYDLKSNRSTQTGTSLPTSKASLPKVLTAKWKIIYQITAT
jgi:hypothetical protein